MTATVSQGLYELLSASSAITAIVGSRIYPAGETPREVVYPYITFQRVSAQHARHMTAGAGIGSALYQIDCFARNSLEADQMADAVRERMDNYRGQAGDIAVRGAFLDDDDHTIEHPDDGRKAAIHRRRLDFTVWHKESVSPVS